MPHVIDPPVDTPMVELTLLDLNTMTVALMRAMHMPQAAIEDEDTRLGAAFTAQKLLDQLPPLYLVRVK
jgi:hypothetical protein